MKKIVLIIVLISLAATLTSCSTGVMSPNNGNPTMEQSYDAALNEQDSFTPVVDQTPQATKIILPTNSTLPKVGVPIKAIAIASTLNSQFPTLPNPQNVMYIFGHYAGNEALPVPGHFTAFPMYLETHYALPTEVQRPYNDGQFVGDNQNA